MSKGGSSSLLKAAKIKINHDTLKMKIPIIFFIPILFWCVETTRHVVREKKHPYVQDIKVISEKQIDSAEIIKFKP